MLQNAKDSDEIFRFSIEGSLTDCLVNELREAILSAIARSEEIEIDLSRVSRIDSAGLLLMIDAKLEALTQEKSLRFVRYSKPVGEMLELSGLVGFFAYPRLGRERTSSG